MPIGLLSVIGNVSGDTMRDFYRRRYHPKLMAVVAVGDFEKHLLERRRDAAKNDGATDDGGCATEPKRPPSRACLLGRRGDDGDDGATSGSRVHR